LPKNRPSLSREFDGGELLAAWRITFAWEGNDAIDVDLEDYH
jgi:hypothetical protein